MELVYHNIMIIVYIVMIIFAFGGAYTTYRFSSRVRVFIANFSEHRATWLVVGAMGVYIVVFCALTLYRYDHFGMRIFDLGNMNQAMWNTVHGDPLRMTTFFPFQSRLFMHVEPIFFLLAPLYTVWQDPRMLLIMQTVILALGAIPTYLLAKKIVVQPFASFVFSLTYLLNPAINQANYSEFHPLVLGVPFILFGFYFALEKKWSLGIIFFLLAMAAREDIAIMVGLFGLYFALVRRQWRFGLSLFVMAALWIGIIFSVIYPTFSISNDLLQYNQYSNFGGSPGAAIKTIVSDPISFLRYSLQSDKISYFIYLFSPFAFVSLASPMLLLTGIFTFATVFLHTLSGQLMIGYGQYHAPLVPPLLLAAMYGFAKLRLKFKAQEHRVIPLLLVMLCLMPLLAVKTAATTRITTDTKLLFSKEKIASAYRAEALIPDDASVVASWRLGSHVSSRKDLYLIGTPFRFTADYIFISTEPDLQCAPDWQLRDDVILPLFCDANPAQYASFLAEIEGNPVYEKIINENGVLLFRRSGAEVVPQ
jgi:uncharacterized membrane protein